MTILFLDQYGDLGGAQRSLIEVAQAATAAGWRAHAGVPAEGPLAEHLRAAGVLVRALASGRYTMGSKTPSDAARFLARLPGQAWRVARLIRESRPDLVYVNGPRLLPAAAWAALGRTPLLFHCHNRLTGGAAALAGRSLRSASVISASRYTLEPLLPYVPPHRRVVIYNGAPPAANAATPPSDSAWRIGVMGRIAPEKGQDVFLRAARILAGDWTCRFVICGAPMFGDPAGVRYLDELRALAQDLPVEWLGFREDAGAVLAALDLLAVPSLTHEATTRVIPEAYAAAVPVIAFATGGIPEIVSDGETGFLVQERTPEALAARLQAILCSGRAPLRAIAESGYTRWKADLTLDLFQRRMLAAMQAAAAV
jgi:glycosyltransferase involved in cell wall biosynthesis